MTRIEIKPEMLQWASRRSRLDAFALEKKFPRLAQWVSGAALPTLKQIEHFAKATHTPLGMLFLNEPPKEVLPIPDFRTMADQGMREPSPDLLDVIYLCQQRQAWYREYKLIRRLDAVDFIGSAQVQNDIQSIAAQMRKRIGFSHAVIAAEPKWEDALRRFISLVDEAGTMVMCSGIVGSNTSRSLDPEEFRGFAFADRDAPLIFLNGKDSKAAQMFTLAHELAHLWLGESAVTDATAMQLPNQAVERWCNQVAAEFLVPLNEVNEFVRSTPAGDDLAQRISRRFKVSSLVGLRRMFDAKLISRAEFWERYHAELARIRGLSHGGSGGNFYLSQTARVSRRFARALIESTLEGHTLYREAMRMLSVSKIGTFNEYGRSLGFPS